MLFYCGCRQSLMIGFYICLFRDIYCISSCSIYSTADAVYIHFSWILSCMVCSACRAFGAMRFLPPLMMQADLESSHPCSLSGSSWYFLSIIRRLQIYKKNFWENFWTLSKFSNKVIFYQILLCLFPVCFPDFIRQIARYPRIQFAK